MYIINVNNTLPLALAVHEISRHFWAAYGQTKFTKRYKFEILNGKMIYKRF